MGSRIEPAQVDVSRDGRRTVDSRTNRLILARSDTVARDKLAYDTTPLSDGYRLSELQPFNVTNPRATWKDVEDNIFNANVAVARSRLLKNMGFDPGQFNCNQPFLRTRSFRHSMVSSR